MLISYYANKKRSPRLPSWQPSLIFFNIPIESGSIIKPCTLKHFQVTYRLHKAGYWTNIIIKVPRRIWIKLTCSKPNMNDLLSRSILCYKERTTGKRVRTINLMLDILPILSVYNLCIFEIHCDFANKCKYVDITNNSHRVKLNRMFLI